MTAQIAIMNKNAVALATDSAVTTRNAQGVKVHNSANKLFTLSKYHPVGIMIYDSAAFMGFPWEPLIKVYRQTLGRRSFDTVAEYVESFFSFLLTQQSLFNEEAQTKWIRTQVIRSLTELNSIFQGEVRTYIDQHGPIDEATAIQLFEQLVTKLEQGIHALAYLPFYSEEESRLRFSQSATAVITESITQVFQALPIEPLVERLIALISKSLLADFSPEHTGIVFAGFGEAEMLPVVEHHWVDSIYAGIVRHCPYLDLSRNLNQSQGAAWIIPFAQSDPVMRFLRGVDPSYKAESAGQVEQLLNDLRGHVAATTSHLYATDDERNNATQLLNQHILQSHAALNETLARLEQERFISPVIDVVNGLPKDDIAAIAESFVNLTSFQRKILREVETVGGPIDVAVISKGDGFIWIKRKHYFEKDLNPAFFANYYGGDGNDE
jgi:hypothetical protein